MTVAGDRRLGDWLIVGQEQWDELERRNQLLVRALAARHPGSRFLFAELPLRPRGLFASRFGKPQRVEANVWRMRALRPFPERFGALDRRNDHLEARQLRRGLRAVGITRSAVWTQDPRCAGLLDALPVTRLVYDLTDDWAAFEADPVRRAAVQKRIEALASRAEVVFACSRVLARTVRARAGDVVHVPNAVERPGPVAPCPADVAALPRPVLGYAGTLHPSRLDVTLLADAAKRRPGWSFALLGPDQLGATDAAALRALPNVHFLGSRPHTEVRSYLTAFDVCLIPHLLTEFTRSLDPLKLYEYLAAGRPVLSTATDNAPELAAHVTEIDDATTLIAAAERELAQDTPERQATRRGAVADATWDARAAAVESALGVGRASPSPQPSVSVVIVSFNTRELLARCLERLRAQDTATQIVVVDNASGDGSAEMVRTRFADFELIELAENAGFARANNLAFASCTGTYVLLLNSDAFLEPGAVAALVAAAERHPRAAAVGPRLRNPDGSLQRSAWPFPDPGRLWLEALGLHRPLRRLGLLEDLGTWKHDEERPVDFLIGACLLLRRDALDPLGGFDEQFWLYGEEADLQRRLHDDGWEVVFTPTTTAEHVGGASSTLSRTRLRHFYAGQRRFLVKHGGRLSWPAARVALLVGSLLRGRWSTARVAVERGR